ncbi:unnamed protein product [Owenia fusiformis]|uniref:lysozyme n=1 Tax=Owenia fusiformis TaxID=6347 RepID=A0A8J1XVD7_OWEFU|nr:unnamed protein product [Owenia fusiformis]
MHGHWILLGVISAALTFDYIHAQEREPVDGGWSNWNSFWAGCNRQCGDNGTQIRKRKCTKPAPKYGGKPCEGLSYERRPCNRFPCVPVDGQWGPWVDYPRCSKSCNGGTEGRYRVCNRPRPKLGGKQCEGPRSELTPCNTQPCPPIDGGWSSWTNPDLAMCSVSCGGGWKTRKRWCVKPRPLNGGQKCQGEGRETLSCNTQPCEEPKRRTISNECIECLCRGPWDQKNWGCEAAAAANNKYRISTSFYIDCGKPGWNYEECVANEECSKHCIRRYMWKYVPRKCYPNFNAREAPECEDYARFHYYGPAGCGTAGMARVNKFVRRVKRCVTGDENASLRPWEGHDIPFKNPKPIRRTTTPRK